MSTQGEQNTQTTHIQKWKQKAKPSLVFLFPHDGALPLMIINTIITQCGPETAPESLTVQACTAFRSN